MYTELSGNGLARVVMVSPYDAVGWLGNFPAPR